MSPPSAPNRRRARGNGDATTEDDAERRRCDDVPSGDDGFDGFDDTDGRYDVGATDDAWDDDDDARDDGGEGRRKSARVRLGRREEDDDDDDARGVANGATRTGRGDAKREDG